MALDWFKLHHTLLNDIKVQRLEPLIFKRWINLLCVASAQEPRGILPPLTDIAFLLRITDMEALDLITHLRNCELIDQSEDGTMTPHGWDKRQERKPSDTSEATRARKQKQRVTDGSHANVTPLSRPESRECHDTDKSREEESRKEESRQYAPESVSDTKYPQAPSIESPLAKEVRRICKKTTMFLGATDVERLQECLMVLEGEKATLEQVQEFGRKCGQHWISRDSQTKLPRAPSFKQVQSHWHEVLELPEPAETVTGDDLDALAAQFAKPQE